MKFIDVTLRDDGFVEQGCWKQTDKFDWPFYSIDEHLLATMCQMSNKKLSVMVDYYYCAHDVKDYPSNASCPELGPIRVCLRKEDVEKGCRFAKELKKYTNCELSKNSLT